MRRIIPVIVLAGVMLCSPDAAFAKAKGSAGGFSTSRILVYVVLPLSLIYSLVITGRVVKKDAECKSLMRQLGGKDVAWNPRLVLPRLEEVYAGVSKALAAAELDPAKELMSERFYQAQKIPATAVQRPPAGAPSDIATVQLSVLTGSSPDVLWVLFKNDGGQSVWKFLHFATGWVVDDIQPAGSTSDLKSLVRFAADRA